MRILHFQFGSITSDEPASTYLSITLSLLVCLSHMFSVLLEDAQLCALPLGVSSSLPAHSPYLISGDLGPLSRRPQLLGLLQGQCHTFVALSALTFCVNRTKTKSEKAHSADESEDV
jgi:hypothetical protein